MKKILAQMNNYRFEEDPNSCKIVILLNNKYALIQPNGMLFEYKGQTEFDEIYRTADNSMRISLNTDKYILLKDDGTLFEYNGITEFEDIKRFDNGSTKLTLTTVVEAGEK